MPASNAPVRRSLVLALAVFIAAFLGAWGVHASTRGAGPSEAGEPDARAALRAALDEALDDERKAIAFYARVMAVHGERRPFANIINAERRHEAALLAQYQRLGLEPPADRWSGHTLEVPATIEEACDASVVAEVRNGSMYDALIGSVADEQVRRVFERLRWASVERHLPAFRRHGSGWEPVEAGGLTEKQRAQLRVADGARAALFGALMTELSGALARGGPEEAVAVCRDRAPAIAERVSAEAGVRIGRTSWKLRNPANAPPVWADLAVDARPTEPTHFADRSGRLGTLAPIRLASACVQCHGAKDGLAPGVAAKVRDLYPEDAATGFAEGDLRGWFWVEVDGVAP